MINAMKDRFIFTWRPVNKTMCCLSDNSIRVKTTNFMCCLSRFDTSFYFNNRISNEELRLAWHMFLLYFLKICLLSCSKMKAVISGIMTDDMET